MSYHISDRFVDHAAVGVYEHTGSVSAAIMVYCYLTGHSPEQGYRWWDMINLSEGGGFQERLSSGRKRSE